MRCAVVGHPVTHSLSPVLHRAAYDELGMDWDYDAVQVESGGLRAHVGALGARWRGLSVTAPLKREALALAASSGGVTDRARLAGAVNTLVLGDADVRGDNTDLPGAVAAVRERHDGPLELVAVLGAGATAASVGLAACELGARQVRLLARDPARAGETVAALHRHPAQPEVLLETLRGREEVRADLLVSTVPAAAQDGDLLARCAGVGVVFEALYDPWPTPLATATLDEGGVLVGGLDLLVHQAALQLTVFTGMPAPLAAMRAAGAAALALRGAADGPVVPEQGVTEQAVTGPAGDAGAR